ncbi:MAG TPA: hypothetical protein VJ577_07945 [Burkholderiaceae bacterium]|nr:hypothetical protein [Burkholderiaceae bacterium]
MTDSRATHLMGRLRLRLLVLAHWKEGRHYVEVAQALRTTRHAVLVPDRADWHATSQLPRFANLLLLSLPAGSPQRNPSEPVWGNGVTNGARTTISVMARPPCLPRSRLLPAKSSDSCTGGIAAASSNFCIPKKYCK